MSFKFLIAFILITGALCGQNFTISGYIKDGRNGESIAGAAIYEEGTNNAVISNEYGFFSLTLPKGKHKIVCAFIGYVN